MNRHCLDTLKQFLVMFKFIKLFSSLSMVGIKEVAVFAHDKLLKASLIFGSEDKSLPKKCGKVRCSIAELGLRPTWKY